ncbi:MAG: YihY family inner membrane protein [Deltaproteobacteria bacterium]|nr:YihY family inner membrane protein [Deltaproteobacteria bacterium]
MTTPEIEVASFGRKLTNGAAWFWAVISSAAYRFYWDDCFSRASALAYATLFALVPVSALSFSMFAVFGLSGHDVGRAVKTILDQLLPVSTNEQITELESQIFSHLQLFAFNVQALNTVSIGVLVFTSIALLNTIESALNVIWRSTSNLSLFSKLTSFWTVLTLGPLLIALSIFWTTQVDASGFGREYSTLYFLLVSYIIPTIVTSLALSILFYKLPAARVGVGDAMLGAVVAAVLFELTKRGFAYYVGISTTYSTIYGVVASIPLFLFWLYVTWVVILFGAEISYQSSSIHILSGLRRFATELGEVGALIGLRLLLPFGRAFLLGKSPPTEGEVAIEAGSDPVLVRTCLNVLSDANILTALDEKTHSRALALAPDRITVDMVLETFRSKEYRKRIEKGLESVKSNALFELLQRGSRGGKVIATLTLAELLTLEANGEEKAK